VSARRSSVSVVIRLLAAVNDGFFLRLPIPRTTLSHDNHYRYVARRSRRICGNLCHLFAAAVRPSLMASALRGMDSTMRRLFDRLWRDDQADIAVEYAVLLALILVVIVAAVMGAIGIVSPHAPTP
jgi:Flp pilus assembly pilin Flp